MFYYTPKDPSTLFDRQPPDWTSTSYKFISAEASEVHPQPENLVVIWEGTMPGDVFVFENIIFQFDFKVIEFEGFVTIRNGKKWILGAGIMRFTVIRGVDAAKELGFIPEFFGDGYRGFRVDLRQFASVPTEKWRTANKGRMAWKEAEAEGLTFDEWKLTMASQVRSNRLRGMWGGELR